MDSMKNRLWTEKYRPKTIDDYVFVDPRQKDIVKAWIQEGICPNLLLVGSPGTGKSSMVNMLINELGVNEYDVMYVNASKNSGIDTLRDQIGTFVQTIPFGDFKIVWLDELDFASPSFQAALRGDMETYSDNVRFLSTANLEYKIIPAIRESRCYKMTIAKPDINDFTVRVAEILVKEDIKFELEVLDDYVRAAYPDLRKCLNQIQNNSKTGELLPVQGNSGDIDELLIEAVGLFKQGKIYDGRKLLLQFLSFNPTRVEDLYKWMYDNLDLWGTTNEQKDAAIIIIRNGLANLPLVGIPEINLSASLAELSAI